MTASQITTAQAETKTPEIKLTSFGDWSGIKSIRVVTTPRFSFFDKSTASDSHWHDFEISLSAKSKKGTKVCLCALLQTYRNEITSQRMDKTMLLAMNWLIYDKTTVMTRLMNFNVSKLIYDNNSCQSIFISIARKCCCRPTDERRAVSTPPAALCCIPNQTNVPFYLHWFAGSVWRVVFEMLVILS